MKNSCFVIMPYGKKKDVDGKEIDFDEIYEYIIEKAVKKLEGFECIRCDNIDEPGWVHKRMIQHIFEDRVAIVDTSTLNANVFYELGVRHALKKGVTVLIQREGTTWPFNIAGLKSIPYTTNPRGVEGAIDAIIKFISNSLKNSSHVDSLVYDVIADLRVEAGPGRREERITKVQVFEYALVNCPGKRIGLVTGDRENIKIGDVWVNSENTDMLMDRYYGTSTSATIRYLGAKKHPITRRVVEDTIADALTEKMGSEKSVDPATVIPTRAGELQQNNNVKWIFHVASAAGQPREGYRPIERIERCVINALKRADTDEFREDKLKSILFPVLGTGPAGGDLKEHGERCIKAAVDYLETQPSSSISVVYFYVWSDVVLEVCQQVVGRHPGLSTILSNM
jgi:O-acetyl-ADP-ribose deacetylase (regulator of RNase III)